MNEFYLLLLSVTLTTILVFAVIRFMPTVQQRLLEGGSIDTGTELERLRQEIAGLRSSLDYERTERSKVANQLIDAYRRISELEKKEQQLQIIIADLQARMETAETKSVTVLGIWTGDNLDTIAERDAIYDAGIEYRPLFGSDATKANILRELRQCNITIIEIGAHGDAETLFIHGEELTAGWWQRVLTGRGVRVAIILACFSDSSVADAFRRAGVPSVIAVQGEIEDRAAIEFAQQFYQLYAAGMAVPQAFREAKLALDYQQAEKLVLRSSLK